MGPTLILEIATDRRETMGRMGEQKIELTFRSFILRFEITSDRPIDRDDCTAVVDDVKGNREL